MKRTVHPALSAALIAAVIGAALLVMTFLSRYDTGQTPGVRYAKPKK
jgi:hypothetical protein